MIKPELEFVYEAEGSLGAPISIGETPDGKRRVIPIFEGSRVEGPLIKGAMMGNAADWQLTRPAALADSGYAETDKRRTAGGNFFQLYQTKEEVGERVLQGILNDELYILTHAEFLEGVRTAPTR